MRAQASVSRLLSVGSSWNIADIVRGPHRKLPIYVVDDYLVDPERAKVLYSYDNNSILSNIALYRLRIIQWPQAREESLGTDLLNYRMNIMSHTGPKNCVIC